MGTQGLLTIMKDDKVLYKIIAGCNGDALYNFANSLLEEKKGEIFCFDSDLLDYIYELALTYNFGCKDCLVIIDSLSDFYRDKYLFDNPRYNHRWEKGVSAYNLILSE